MQCGGSRTYANVQISLPVFQCVLRIYQGLRVKLQAPAVWLGRQRLTKFTVCANQQEVTERRMPVRH